MDIGTLMASIGADISDLKVSVRKSNALLKSYESNTDKTLKNVDKGWVKSSKTIIASIARFAGPLGIGLGAFELIQFTKSTVMAGVELDSLNRSLLAITGTTLQASKEFAFVNSTAKDLGLNLQSLESSYKDIIAASRGTSLEGEKIKKVFTSISKVSAVLGLSADDTKGALRALSQMISKGTVQAEELRGQLGERIPGAFQTASRAMGVTTKELGKMLEQGQVLATDLIPKLAQAWEEDYGDAAESAGESSRAAFENMNTAVLELKRNLAGSGITDFFADLARSATVVINMFNKMGDSTKSVLDNQIADIENQIKVTVAAYNKEAATRDEIHRESVKRMKDRENEYLKELSFKRKIFSKVPFVNPDIMTQAEKFESRVSELTKKLNELKEIRALEDIFTDFIGLPVVVEKANEAIDTTVKKLTDLEKMKKKATESLANIRVGLALDDFFADIERVEDKLRDVTLGMNLDKINLTDKEQRMQVDPEEVKRTKEILEERLEIQKEFDAEFEKLGLNKFEIESDLIEKQAELYKKAGADKVKVDEWASKRGIEISRAEQSAKLDIYKNIAGGIAGTFKDIAQAGGKYSKEAFVIYKATAMAQAAISGYQAVLVALASAPPPFNFILAAISGAAAAVQIGLIASSQPPSYDSGGISNAKGIYQTGNIAEAHIPIPSGGKIPVKMDGGGGGQKTVQIILNNPVFQDAETQRQTMIQIASVVAAQVAPGAVVENYRNDGPVRQMVRGGV